MECNIVYCKVKGNVIIVKLDNEDDKKEIMMKKKLAGGRVFIEYDLS